jgi:hypothetical protein
VVTWVYKSFPNIRSFQFAPEQQPGLPSATGQCILRRNWSPADFCRMANHGHLDAVGFCDIDGGHVCILLLE